MDGGLHSLHLKDFYISADKIRTCLGDMLKQLCGIKF